MKLNVSVAFTKVKFSIMPARSWTVAPELPGYDLKDVTHRSWYGVFLQVFLIKSTLFSSERAGARRDTMVKLKRKMGVRKKKLFIV